MRQKTPITEATQNKVFLLNVHNSTSEPNSPHPYEMHTMIISILL